MNYTFRVIKNGKTIDRCQTHHKRRFYNKIRSINWENEPLKVYLRVSYGKAETNRGTIETFYNDGTYETRNELLSTLDVFVREGEDF